MAKSKDYELVSRNVKCEYCDNGIRRRRECSYCYGIGWIPQCVADVRYGRKPGFPEREGTRDDGLFDEMFIQSKPEFLPVQSSTAA